MTRQRRHAPDALLSSRDTALGPVRALLDRDEALVVFDASGARGALNVRVVEGDEASPLLADPVAVSDTAIRRFLRFGAAGVLPRALARQLGAALLDSALARLPGHVRRLVVVAPVPLQALPFHALLLADGRLASERFSITLSPSLGGLRAVRTQGRDAGPGPSVVAAGDPDLRGRTGEALVSWGRHDLRQGLRASLPRLMHSGREARRAAALGRPSRLLLRGDATEAALRAASRGAAVVHLATHLVGGALEGGLDARGGSPHGLPALALSVSGNDDGWLTGEELSRLPLHGALVVLSACSTLSAAGAGGEERFAERALAGGAAAVIATRWPVRDREAGALIARFYAHLAAGARADDALHLAVTEARGRGASFREWGGFVLVGDGRWTFPRR